MTGMKVMAGICKVLVGET